MENILLFEPSHSRVQCGVRHLEFLAISWRLRGPSSFSAEIMRILSLSSSCIIRCIRLKYSSALGNFKGNYDKKKAEGGFNLTLSDYAGMVGTVPFGLGGFSSPFCIETSPREWISPPPRI